MRITIAPRLLHFRQPAGTSRGVYTTRQSWLVTVADPADPHHTGTGECAPLPDLSCDFSPAYEPTLRRLCRLAESLGRLPLDELRPYPSMLFGLETAMLHYERRSPQLFDTPFSRGEEGIPINGLVWMGAYDEMLLRMEEKLRQGFSCIKLKIGAIDFDSELHLIELIRRRFSAKEVEIRVDANGAFSPADALPKLERLARFGLHSIEQPIRQGQWQQMARLCRETPLPIALDEELIGVNRVDEKASLLDTIRPQYIILKPSLHGGMQGCGEWIRLARERGTGSWMTSALESNVGLNAVAHFAAHAYGPSITQPQGLGTGALFTDNIAMPLQIRGERLWYNPAEQFRQEWADGRERLLVHTSGSTGRPKPLLVEKRRMEASARSTCRALGLKPGFTALLCLSAHYIAGKMMIVRALTAGLRLVEVPPSGHPLATVDEPIDFAAMVPLQVSNSLQTDEEARRLRAIRHLIIGGGAIDESLERQLRSFPNAVWSTYGMTETLSHIALRRVSGPEATEWYEPLPGVEVRLVEVRLSILAPEVCAEELLTNDLAELHADGRRFRITGRADNVICSGGVKIQIEEVEAALRPHLPFPFLITRRRDVRLGEAVTMLHTGSEAVARAACQRHLSPYQRPRHFIRISSLPLTPTGKPARAEAERIANQ